jgi:hypothetical protein
MDKLTLEQAADLAGTTTESVRLWCKRHKLGKRDDKSRRWWVNAAVFRDFLATRSKIVAARKELAAFTSVEELRTEG